MRYEEDWLEPEARGTDVVSAWIVVCALFAGLFLASIVYL